MMLPVEVDLINKRLIDLFGIDTITGMSIWRISWSDDQFEHRLTDCADSGIILAKPEVRYLPKYAQWIHQKYILERLVLIPEINQRDLPATKLSYECLYVFQDRFENALPPKLEACQFIINTVLAAQATAKAMLMGNERPDHMPMKRYTDPENTQEASLQLKKERVDRITEELFGEDSGLTGLRTGESIISPGSGNQHNNGNES